MFLVESIKTFGSYLLLMKRVLTKPERWGMFFRRTVHEIYQLGINSIPIVLIISLFIGAALCIQMKTNVESPWMPKFVTGYATREVLLLEFSSTIMCLILAGKVGSNITSEIGAMRVTQQIDALEMMGVNSAKDIRTRLYNSHTGNLQYSRRYWRRIPYWNTHRNHDSRRAHRWTPARIHGMVHLVQYYKEFLLCLYHHIGCFILWL